MDEAVLCLCEFPEAREGRLAGHPFPQLDLQLRVKYADCTKFTPLTYLWTEGVHAGKFKVKFREPNPII